MNIIWIILPGLELAIMRLLLAAFFALTIIGFPLAVQHMKLVPMALLPFGHVMRDIEDQEQFGCPGRDPKQYCLNDQPLKPIGQATVQFRRFFD